jgi:hypothetical protein
MTLFENLPPEPSLLEYRQGAGTFPGTTVAFNGWTGNQNIRPFWLDQGYAGIHVMGRGPERTIYRSMTSESTLIFGRHCGYVKIENVTIQNGFAPGKQKAIFGGVDAANAPDLVPYTIHLKNCVIETARTADPDGHPEWPIFINQGDIILENCVIRSRNSNEHALYVHGFGRYGAYIINTVIDGVGAEGLKFTARPQARYYQDPGLLQYAGNAYTDGYHPIEQTQWIVVRNTQIHDWNQPWSWRGGAGMTVQGAGINVLVEDSAFVDFHELKPALAFDDSGVEHFGDGNIAGRSPANQDIIVRRTTLASGPGPSWYTNVARIGSLNPNSSVLTVKSALFEDCGIYGDHMMLSVSNCDNLRVRNCNTPAAAERARTFGVDTTHEAMLAYNGFRPVSQGYGN